MGVQCYEDEGHELGTGGTACAVVEKHVVKETGEVVRCLRRERVNV